jgi:putative membrane protein
VSELNDPRVLFAAERTLLAWVRTVAGLMAMGFLIDRTALLAGGDAPGRLLAPWIGIAFVLAGVALSVLSIVQYRRSVAGLRPAEIPANYWVNLAPLTSALIGLLGLTLTAYLLVA